jgi:DNA-binding MarR family transcriptional regulator
MNNYEEKLNQLFNQFRGDDAVDAEREYICQHIDTQLLKKVARMTRSETEVVAGIFDNQNQASLKSLTNILPFTQGMLSRNIASLVNQGLIEKYYAPNNKKEVLLRLTDDGTKFAKVHAQMHRVQDKQNRAILKKYSNDQLETVISFLTDLDKSRRNLK